MEPVDNENQNQGQGGCASTPAINEAFSKKNPFLQTIWDATSLGTLKECPRKYFLSIVQGWQPKTSAVALSFGVLLHECLENFYRREVEGMEREKNIRQTIRECVASPIRAEIDAAGDSVRNMKSLVVTPLRKKQYQPPLPASSTTTTSPESTKS